jgi:hypothetical protein
MNPYTAWMLWLSTWHLGMSQTYMEWAQQMESDAS